MPLPPRSVIRVCLRAVRMLPMLAALWACAAEAGRAAEPEAPIATVNGDAITVREFVEALRRARALHEDDAQLRSAALAACVRFVVTLRLAREHGVTTIGSDAELRREFAVENARRAAMLAKGGVVYGPRKLSWDQFRATWLDRIERELGRALLARSCVPARRRSKPRACGRTSARDFRPAHAARFPCVLPLRS